MIYREIYVGDEAQLAAFSHRTAAMLAVLDGHVAELAAFRDWLLSIGPSISAFFDCGWQALAARAWRGANTSSVERYLGSLAFATAPYAPEPERVAAVVAELQRARFVPDPFVHSP